MKQVWHCMNQSNSFADFAVTRINLEFPQEISCMDWMQSLCYCFVGNHDPQSIIVTSFRTLPVLDLKRFYSPLITFASRYSFHPYLLLWRISVQSDTVHYVCHFMEASWLMHREQSPSPNSDSHSSYTEKKSGAMTAPLRSRFRNWCLFGRWSRFFPL